MRRYGKFFGILAIGLATMLTLADTVCLSTGSWT